MRSRKREILATAFDKAGDDWIYYSNAWSRGVLVNSDERELYLTWRLLAFRRAIAGRRPSEPKRPYWPTVKRLLIALLTGRDPASTLS
jgi:hypothetical protein